MKTKNSINEKANEIIAFFMIHNIPLTQQLEILKTVRRKIEFCKKTAKEVTQHKLKV